jgi:hypothetical protein
MGSPSEACTLTEPKRRPQVSCITTHPQCRILLNLREGNILKISTRHPSEGVEPTLIFCVKHGIYFPTHVRQCRRISQLQITAGSKLINDRYILEAHAVSSTPLKK